MRYSMSLLFQVQPIYITISTVTSVCPSVRPMCDVRHKIFFSRKMPWNHSLTPGIIIPAPGFDPPPHRGHVNALGRGVAELRISKPSVSPGKFTLLGKA